MICSKANKFQTVSNNILNSNSNFFTTENAKNLINRMKEKNQKKSNTTQFRGIYEMDLFDFCMLNSISSCMNKGRGAISYSLNHNNDN